jgi:hypothetical protein
MGSLIGNFRKTCIVVAATLVATSQARADKHTVYDLTPELLAIGASGTITTDAKTGVLSPSDIIDWNILLHAPGLQRTDYDFTLTPINSYVAATFGSDLTADASGLHWDFGATDSEQFDIQMRSSTFGCTVCSIVWRSYGNRDFSYDNAVMVAGTNFSATLSEPAADLLIAARIHGPVPHLNNLPADVADPAASVPEPSTWAMMLLGFCGLGFMFHGRRTEIATPATD